MCVCMLKSFLRSVNELGRTKMINGRLVGWKECRLKLCWCSLEPVFHWQKTICLVAFSYSPSLQVKTPLTPFCLYRQKSFCYSLSLTAPGVVGLFSPFQNKPWFLRICSTSLLKTLWETEKLLVTSNFSFPHSVFYPSEELSVIVIKFEIVVCKTNSVLNGSKTCRLEKGWEQFSVSLRHDSLTRGLLTLL